MRGLLGKFHGLLVRFHQRVRWEREAQRERKTIVHDKSLKQVFNGRCLILIPHSDDEWIGCSRILFNNRDVVLCNMDMSGGDSKDLHEERFREMSMVAESSNHKLITVDEKKEDSLKRILDEQKPDFVFLPHFIDWHPEHIEVMKLLKKAMSNQLAGSRPQNVVMYQVSCPIISGITHALPMSQQDWKEKWNQFSVFYPTQRRIPTRRFALNEKINGGYIGAFAAEVYCERDTEKWLTEIEQKIPSSQETSDLKYNLRSVSTMRQYIKREFKEII